MLVVIAGLSLFYFRDQYPFTQDDNFCQFLPVIIRSAETLISGRFPVWNPYQLLGSPTTTVGTYALTYPPIYCSYWIAHYLLHNDYTTLEIFAWFHLLSGYIVSFYVLRQFKISAPISASASICWILSGWFLIGGRSQFNYVPLAVFFPLLVHTINLFQSKPINWRWCISTGIIIGIYYHSGHAEFWTYALMFWALAILFLLISGNVPRYYLLWAISALLVGISIAAPLLWLQKLETDGISRIGGYGCSIQAMAAFLPLNFLKSVGLSTGSLDYQSDLGLFYAGTIFTVLAITTLALWFANQIVRPGNWRPNLIAANPLLLSGGFAFLLALAAPAIVWSILSWLPVFNKFRWPIKYTPFFQLLFIFAGAIISERLFSAKYLHKYWRYGILALTTLLMLINASLCHSTFF